jgi:hypothetical protein
MQKEMLKIAQDTIAKVGFFHSGRLQYATSLRLVFLFRSPLFSEAITCKVQNVSPFHR